MKLPADLIARAAPAFAGLRVCVTGGAGFIGGHLIDALLSLPAKFEGNAHDRPLHITIIDDLSNSSVDHLAELIELEPDRLRFIHSSILDPVALTEALHGCDLVFHLAAMGSVPASIAEPARAFAVNATGTVRVLEAARAAGVKRFVNSSSSSVYGEGPGGSSVPGVPKIETQLPQPISPYAASKLAAESAVRAWACTYAMQGVSLRYFNVFGPRQSTESQYAAVVPAFARRVLAGLPPIIFGDGSASRDFTPVASVVAANLLAGATTSPLRGQSLNVGTGARLSVAELARLVCAAAGTPHLTPAFQPARAGDIHHSLADISAARALLGYAPIEPAPQAIAATVNWYRQALSGAGPAGSSGVPA